MEGEVNTVQESNCSAYNKNIVYDKQLNIGWFFSPREWPTIATFVAACAAMAFFTAAKMVVAVLG